MYSSSRGVQRAELRPARFYPAPSRPRRSPDLLRVELPEPLHARALVVEEAGPNGGGHSEPSLEDGVVVERQR